MLTAALMQRNMPLRTLGLHEQAQCLAVVKPFLRSFMVGLLAGHVAHRAGAAALRWVRPISRPSNAGLCHAGL